MKRSGYGDRAGDASLIDELREELLADLEERLERQRLRKNRYPRRRVGRLRREIHDELQSMRAIENRMQRSRVSPEARALLYELIDEAAGQGLTMDDLYRALPRPPVTDRLLGFLQSRNGLILLLALLALLASPSAREMIKPALGKISGELNELADMVRGVLSKVKEGIEDVVAEAKFENLKDAMEKAINEDLPADPGPQTN